MPLVVAAALRSAIQAAITVGSWIAVEQILGPWVEKAIVDYQKKNGMTEQEAIDSTANDVIQFVLLFGTTAAVIRSKFPTKIAERLGFTTKGWTLRPTKTKPGQTSGPITLPTPATVGTGVGAASTFAANAINVAKATKPGFSAAYDRLVKSLGVVFVGTLALSGPLDWAAWNQSAYQEFFQKLFEKITFGLLKPDEDYRKSLTVSDEIFSKVYNTYKIEGAIGINDPYKNQQVEFTRENFIDLLDKVGAELLRTLGSASTKNVLLATQALMIFDKSKFAAGSPATASAGGALSLGTGTSTSLPRVYTGIVSQGVLGKGLEFTARPDDLIESQQELLEAAANNLAPFLAALPARIVYEVKIVSSIITRDGFKQTGTVQQIRSGTTASGAPKFKTVVNKFATLNLYVVTDKGTRSKITTIVLGPTNSAKLVLNPNDLRSVETQLPSLVSTSDINLIKGLETVQPVTVSTPASALKTATPAPQITASPVATGTISISPAPGSVLGESAATLSEWFAAQGQSLPTVQERSRLYEQLGLGIAVYYTGTAEQNSKLLTTLKVDAIKKATTTRTLPEGAYEIAAEDDAPDGFTVERIAGKLYAYKEAPTVSSGSGGGALSREPVRQERKETTAAAPSTTSRDSGPVKAIRSYTTTKGERVTKFSDGSEKRIKVKK